MLLGLGYNFLTQTSSLGNFRYDDHSQIVFNNTFTLARLFHPLAWISNQWKSFSVPWSFRAKRKEINFFAPTSTGTSMIENKPFLTALKNGKLRALGLTLSVKIKKQFLAALHLTRNNWSAHYATFLKLLQLAALLQGENRRKHKGISKNNAVEKF